MTDFERTTSGFALFYGLFSYGAGVLWIALGLIDLAFWWFLVQAVLCAAGFLLIVWADRRASLDRATGTHGGVPMELLEQDHLEKPREL